MYDLSNAGESIKEWKLFHSTDKIHIDIPQINLKQPQKHTFFAL